MRITTKGQVTIPQPIREKLGISPAVEVDFVEENGRIYLVKKRAASSKTLKYRRLRGIATVKMTTDEIMALTRGEK
ncbi:MAG: AbrB/MazE/SpoVT family DNA-binding domain-containing protein [Candidatus Brocadiaceae bacterium]|nr:AbrB/MazE/SpoVT family DNA-binding domain-containing protein [Candidatus Brocadiaceae bacterium]